MAKGRKMKDVRIRKRLMRGFVFITVITAVAAVLGVIAMFIITNRYDNAMTNYGFSQGDIGKAMTSLAEARSSLRAAIGYDVEEEIQKAVENYETDKQSTIENVEHFQQYMVKEESKKLYEEVVAALDAYWVISDDIVKQGATTDEQLSAAAQVRAVDEVRPAYEAVYNAMDELMDLNVDKGNELEVNLKILMWILIAVIVVTIVTAFVLSTKIGAEIAAGIEKPIKETAARLVLFAKGDLDSEFPETEYEDEIHEMLSSVKQMATDLNAIITDMGHVLSEMAKGNFTAESAVAEKYAGKFALLLQSTEQMSETMDATLQKVEEASSHVSAGSGNLAEAAEALADGATEQAGAVEELQATIADVTATAEKTADDLRKTANMALNYAEDAGHGREQMKATVQAMERISDSSMKIENIISELEDIASQTNLLSLNASIEAARAGEAGRGFAVVADQIRTLAEQSATSAVSTRELIEGSMQDVQEGNKAVEVVSETLNSVAKGMAEIASSADTLSEQSTNQAKAMEQVEMGINQISEVVQSNSASAEETSATSEELSAQAETLETLVGNFQLRSHK